MVPKAPVSNRVLLYCSKGLLSPRFSYITLFLNFYFMHSNYIYFKTLLYIHYRHVCFLT